jgi:hypothetical protein
MSSENDASILPETVVSQSEANAEAVATAEAVTEPLVSPVSVPSSARLENVQSAYEEESKGDRAGQESVQLVTPLSGQPPALPVRPSIVGKPSVQTDSSISLQCTVCAQLQGESDKLALSIQDLVQANELSMLNIIQICLSLMTMAEQIPYTTGPQRKQIVLQAVATYLQKTGGDLNLVNLLPPFIDSAIALEKGDTRIATEEAVVGCFGCLTFCSKKNSRKSSEKKSKCGSQGKK